MICLLFLQAFTTVVHTRIKICGITRPGDAEQAMACGADALGLVFYAPSPRAVSLEQAREIMRVVPPFVSVVALFVNETAEQVRRIKSELGIDLLQFHGDESAAFCDSFEHPYLKALRVRPGMDLAEHCAAYPRARAVLLDSWQEGVPGGTGKTFDWRLADGELPLPVVLAGGLNPENVASAIAQLRPAADVDGGVESEPGRKDAGKIRDFIAAVRAADNEVQG